MTTMTMRPQARTRPAPARMAASVDHTLLEEILAWSALAGFAAVCFFIFAIAIWT
jgi:hypothetical protein